ncbi:glycosyltransferase family 2 protein [Rhodococcoides kroppenstedtii]|uniref:glycosyltransferase family 2 protein n=1 Tax=Rhodococcoides kroppenstedtii TaxID=293050 RepID=UPI001427A3C0|nr:glycosyltransferase family 2 protein [Rhodococcus kroppenstedtii]NIL82462.1 hypothetical protein [Rhodococcus kroppenstedtii]
MDILLVLYRAREAELKKTLRALALVRDEFANLRILVSGPKADFERVTQQIRLAGLVSKTCLTHRYDNIGFAGGQNMLLAQAFGAGATFALVYNPDLVVARGALTALLACARENKKVGLLGPWIEASYEEQEGRFFDSRGIGWSRDGRHFDIGQGRAWVEPPSVTLNRVDGLTGACLLVSRQTYLLVVSKCLEFFDGWFVAYREDAELGRRCDILGITSSVVSIPGFVHARGVSGNSRANPLVNSLSVQNRFFMRFKLRGNRPGNIVFQTVRDAVVAAACLTVERSSLTGLKNAVALRRSAKYKGQICGVSSKTTSRWRA